MAGAADSGGIHFDADEKAAIVDRIRTYFADALKQDIGRSDAEFLLDFFTTGIGAYDYNRGVQDAHAVVAGTLATVDDALYRIEKPTALR